MLLGAIVIVVVGIFVVNYFRNLNTGDTLPGVNIENTEEAAKNSLPATHVVTKGETLWSIAKQYYDSGYNWIDIAKANSLANPGKINVGQELTIPNAQEKLVAAKGNNNNSGTEQMQKTSEPTPQTYTVQHGDNLWNIAVKTYGDGFRWLDIAKANNLTNPRIIHAGNNLKLPQG